MKRKTKIILLFLFATVLLTPLTLQAQQASILSAVTCIANHDQSGPSQCKVDDIIVLVKELMLWGFRISGALALFMYVIGGTWMIISAGNSSRIERGKDILVGTSVALIFIFGSSVIVNFILTGLESTYVVKAVCANATNNTRCGDNMVCYNKECISQCTLYMRQQSATGAGGSEPMPSLVWACQDVTQQPCHGIATYLGCAESTPTPGGPIPWCIRGLCPPSDNLNMVCCSQA